MKNIEPVTTYDLFESALHQVKIDPLRALAAYADPSNWVQVYNGELANGNKCLPCEWAFIGPTRPGYELAQHVLRQVSENC